MQIKWFGSNSFLIDGKKVKVAVDPKDETVTAEIILKTEHSGVDTSEGMVIDWPGEFESNDVIIHAEPIGVGKDEKRIISFELDEVRFCAMANVEEVPKGDVINELGDVDVLLMPVTIKPKIALEIIEEIDPRLVVLSSMDVDGADLPGFLKEVGQTGLAAEDKIEIKSRASLDSENVVYKYLG